MACDTIDSSRVETEASGDAVPEAFNNSEAVRGTGATIKASAMDCHFCSARDEGKADDSSDSGSIVHKSCDRGSTDATPNAIRYFVEDDAIVGTLAAHKENVDTDVAHDNENGESTNGCARYDYTTEATRNYAGGSAHDDAQATVLAATTELPMRVMTMTAVLSALREKALSVM